MAYTGPENRVRTHLRALVDNVLVSTRNLRRDLVHSGEQILLEEAGRSLKSALVEVFKVGGSPENALDTFDARVDGIRRDLSIAVDAITSSRQPHARIILNMADADLAEIKELVRTERSQQA